MSLRPKMQDSVVKSKSVTQSGDQRNRNVSNPSPSKLPEKTVAEISMKDFLDFLKISYQVNEAIDNSLPDVPEKVSVDWKKLTADILINRLKEKDGVFSKDKIDSLKCKTSESCQIVSESDVNTYYEGQTVRNTSTANDTNSEDRSSEKSSESHKPLERLSSTLSLDRKLVADKIKGNRRKSISKKNESVESETSRSIDLKTGLEDPNPSKILKKKLNEVLQEGILDSVLPYLLPKHVPQTSSQTIIKKALTLNEAKKYSIGNIDKNEKAVGYQAKERFENRRKSVASEETENKNEKDLEVVIHVCDEIKNLKRDFKCSQKLLISQMGYFAEVTSGQKLEDMDISVHCDVTIFDWLMRWVQKDKYSKEQWPSLDSSIVIPVLMSSAFLQMDPLQEHCLQYCKNHINDIIRDSPNLSCINDNMLTRLADLFSNTEVENIKDKKDKIQSKLFCKLITALTEPEAQPQKGHYSSIATIYRCAKCSKIILKNLSSSIFCIPSNMTVDRNGLVNSVHIYDSSWNLTDYVRDMKADLKTWRKVYWRLWGECHLLYCQACEEYFPVNHFSWCRFHLESVQYFPLENQRSAYFPVGRYSCCGERAYRFETVKKLSGCQYRDHITNPKTSSEIEILRIWNIHKDIIKDEPPPLLPPERIRFIKPSRDHGPEIKSPIKDVHWWNGLELIPPKQETGLLVKMLDTVFRKDDVKCGGNSFENKNSRGSVPRVSTQSSLYEVSSFSDSSDESSSSSNAGNSEESRHSTKALPKHKGLTSSRQITSARNEGNHLWITKLSTRSNQDNQREFEERTIGHIESVLAKKFSGDNFRSSSNKSSYQIIPPGGVYVKIEQDWREAFCFSQGCPGSSIKVRGSNSFVNVNGTNFSLQKRSKSKGHR